MLRLQSLIEFGSSTNLTMDNFDVVKWSTIEVNVGIICACMPTMRLLLQRFFPNIIGSTLQKYGSGVGKSSGGSSQLSQREADEKAKVKSAWTQVD
jgi:hypothetical protein